MNVELELIFHLLEQVGLALRNIWLHDQLAGNHEMMTDVLRELSSACVVVGRDLKVLHANKAARAAFWPEERTHRQTGIHRFAAHARRKNLSGAKDRRGAGTVPLRAGKFSRHRLQDQHPRRFSTAIPPCPRSALLTAEDLSESEH